MCCFSNRSKLFWGLTMPKLDHRDHSSILYITKCVGYNTHTGHSNGNHGPCEYFGPISREINQIMTSLLQRIYINILGNIYCSYMLSSEDSNSALTHKFTNVWLWCSDPYKMYIDRRSLSRRHTVTLCQCVIEVIHCILYYHILLK